MVADTWEGKNENTAASAELNGAYQAGVANLAAYMVPNLSTSSSIFNQPDCGIAQEFATVQDLLEDFPTIAPGACSPPVANTSGVSCPLEFLAIDIEKIKGDEYKTDANSIIDRINCIDSAVKEAKKEGFFPIIYTTRDLWSDLAGGTALFSNLPLWDTTVDYSSDLDITCPKARRDQVNNICKTGNPPQFVGYGGWTTRSAKQYIQCQSAARNTFCKQFGQLPGFLADHIDFVAF